MIRFIFLGLCLLLTGCQAHLLNVQTQYLTRENLASFYVGTPDANQHCPAIGQRLLIDWVLPKDFLCYPELSLSIKVRYKNHKEEEVSVPIKDKKGTCLYNVFNDKFCETGGVVTYKIDLKTEQTVLESWVHPLWRELITFEGN